MGSLTGDSKINIRDDGDKASVSLLKGEMRKWSPHEYWGIENPEEVKYDKLLYEENDKTDEIIEQHVVCDVLKMRRNFNGER